eukprot:3360634-Rhodomonas_salina.1
MSGTDLVYGAIRLRRCYAMSGTDVVYGREGRVGRCADVCQVAYRPTRCYAMSGTAIAYDTISQRRCYAMPSTGIAYGRYAMSGTDVGWGIICLRRCYAMSGTEIPYAAARNRAVTLGATALLSENVEGLAKKVQVRSKAFPRRRCTLCTASEGFCL